MHWPEKLQLVTRTSTDQKTQSLVNSVLKL
jgi:hypothetical protein